MRDYGLMLFLMALVTFIPRYIPFVILSRCRIPDTMKIWLSYVPVAVLAALLAPAIFAPAGTLSISLTANPFFWASIPLFIIAYYTKNLFITVLSGMIIIALLRLIIT